MEYDPKKFYKTIGAQGLATMAREKVTKGYLTFLKKFLEKNKKILDVACGYGRLTIPLVQEGYSIEGIDISPNLIKEAKQQAKSANLTIAFNVGDMRDLPYKGESFDVVICIWSSFSYMLTKKDQVTAIKQMLKVLSKNGLLIIDLPYVTKKRRAKGTYIKEYITKEEILGCEHIVYLHTKETLNDLLAGIKKVAHYDVKYQNIGGRRRLVAFIRK